MGRYDDAPLCLFGLGGGTEAFTGGKICFLLHACVQGSCGETEDSERFSNAFDHPDGVTEDEAGAGLSLGCGGEVSVDV